MYHAWFLDGCGGLGLETEVVGYCGVWGVCGLLLAKIVERQLLLSERFLSGFAPHAWRGLCEGGFRNPQALARDHPQIERHREAKRPQSQQRKCRRNGELKMQGAARPDSHNDSGSTPKFVPSGITHPLLNKSQEFVARQFTRSEAEQVSRGHLAIDQFQF